MKITLQDEIKQTVKISAQCPAVHVKTVTVVEMFAEKVAWDGALAVFDLKVHPKAKRAYGWADHDGKETRYVAVLEIPPLDLANTAVRLTIAQKVQK